MYLTKRFCSRLVLVLVLLAMCAGVAPAKSVTLQVTMWGNNAQKDLFESLCADFAKNDPEVDKVNITLVAQDYKNKVALMFLGGTPPDLVFLDSLYSKEWFAAGFIMDIESYLKQQPVNTADFFEPFWDSAIYAGKRYGLPMWGGGLRTDIYMINRDLFNQNGLPLPNVTQNPSADAWTTAMFRAAAVKLTRDTNGDGQVDQWGYAPTSRWFSWVFSEGGQLLSADRTQALNEQATIAAFQYLADLRVKDRANSTNANFVNGRVGINQVLFPNLGQLKINIGKNFDWFVTHQPRGAAGSINYAKMNVVSIPKGVPNPDASWRLLRYLSGKESATLLARNYVSSPWLKSVARSREFLYSNEPPYDVSANVFGESYALPLTTAWAEVDKIWTDATNKIFAGTEPAAVATVEMTRLINGVLQNYAAKGPLY